MSNLDLLPNWLGERHTRLMRAGGNRQRPAAEPPITPARWAPNSSRDAARSRALEIEALAWTTPNIASEMRPRTSPVGSRKRPIIGWIKTTTILAGAAMATLYGGEWIDTSS
jgi:hypothetical protein